MRDVSNNGSMEVIMAKDMKKEIGKKLKKLRKDSGLSQEKIAEKLNTTIASYGKYERGTAPVQIDVLVRLADMYNLSMDYILCRTDSPKIFTGEEYEGLCETMSATEDRIKTSIKDVIEERFNKLNEVAIEIEKLQNAEQDKLLYLRKWLRECLQEISDFKSALDNFEHKLKTKLEEAVTKLPPDDTDISNLNPSP